VESRQGSRRRCVPAARLSLSVVLLGVLSQPVFSLNRVAARTVSLPTEASISGRVVAEAGADIQPAVGLRVNASDGTGSRWFDATVAYDWSFLMTIPSGFYLFSAVADREPFVKATRIVVDGTEAPATTSVRIAEGRHKVVVFVGRRELPEPAVDKTLALPALVEQFKSEANFIRQFAIAQEIAGRHDARILPSLAAWLTHEDRHARGNAAFIFASLGDPRGFQVITGILTDRSDRPRGVIAHGNWTLQAQIRSDRYFAVHLLGNLRDVRALPILTPLLTDAEVNYHVPWALGRIGDKRAIAPLLDALNDESPSIRVLVIYALETLKAREAVPRLVALLNDQGRSNFGAQVTVADAARAAIAALQ
jgi:hypothetical protein